MVFEGVDIRPNHWEVGKSRYAPIVKVCWPPAMLLEERQQQQPHYNNSSRSPVFFYSPLILSTVVALAQNQKRMMRIVHLDPDPANANTAGMNHDLQRAKRVFRVPPPAKDVVPAQPSMHWHSQTEYALAAASTESDDLSPPVLLRGPPDRTTSVRVSTR
jgi:hypothetical protein